MTASESDTWLLTKFTEPTLPLPTPTPLEILFMRSFGVFNIILYHLRDHLRLANDIRLKHRSNISKNLHIFLKLFIQWGCMEISGAGSHRQGPQASSTRSEDKIYTQSIKFTAS